MIAQLKSDYPVRWVCAALDCALSSVYYQPRQHDESALISAIEVLLRFPYTGIAKSTKNWRGLTSG